MNFQELGLTLQRERERLGLSIAVVMEATKISRTNIVAIENGDRSSLPHPVYAKGFIKSYARYLGLDADELLMVIDREYQDEAGGPEEHIYEVSPAAERAFHEKDSSDRKNRTSWLLWFVMVLLVAGAVFLVLNYTGKNKDVSEKSAVSSEPVETVVQPETLPDTSAVLEGNASEQNVSKEPGADEIIGAPAVEEGTSSVPSPDETTTKPDTSSVKPESKPDKSASLPEKTVKPGAKLRVQEDVEAVANASLSESDKQKYEHVLIIRATSAKGCWIGLWKGDEPNMAKDFVLTEGEPLRLMFNSLRRIRIGNVAGVSVTYNGKPYPLNGARGNIQTLRFGTE